MIRRSAIFIFLACSILVPSCAKAQSWNGWHPTAWGLHRWRTNDVAPTATVWAVTNQFTYTNHVGTNTIVSNVVFSQTYTFQQLTQAVVRSFYAYGVASNGSPDAFYVSVTAMPYQTSITLQPREVRAWDAYLAIRERMRAITNDSTVNATLYSFPPLFRGQSTVQGYGSLDGGMREQLLWCKAWAANTNWTGEFLWQHILPTNNADYEAWFASNSVYSVPRYTNSQDLLRGGATNLPANYLIYTPNRYLDCLNDGYGRIVTTRIYYVGAGTVVTSVNWCGDTVIVTNGAWTNGAFVTVSCTNDWWTGAGLGGPGPEWEYYTDDVNGWCGMTNILNQLRYTTSGFCGNDASIASYITEASSLYDYESGPPCTTITGAIESVGIVWNAESALGCGGSTNDFSFQWGEENGCALATLLGRQFDAHAYVSQCPPFSTNISGTAGAISRGAYLRHYVGSASTGIAHRADLYLACSTNRPSGILAFPPPLGVVCNWYFEYDNFGVSMTTNMSVFGSVTNAGPTDSYILFGDDPDVKLPIPTSPTNTMIGAGDYVIRGHDNPSLFWVIDWTVDGGFKYK